jgi:hypothetical protein
MNLHETLQYLLPGAQCELRDDGQGAFIHAWHDSRPQPTDAEIAAAWETIQAAPPPLPPITRRQLRRALYRVDLAPGVSLLDAVESLVAEIGGDLAIWWGDGDDYGRADPIMVAVMDLIGATPEQADAVWQMGVTL